MVFFFWGGACACTVLLCSKKKTKKQSRTKKEGAEALDRGLLVYTVDKREEIKGLFATAVTSAVVGSTFQSLNSHILPHEKLQNNFKECQVNLDLVLMCN